MPRTSINTDTGLKLEADVSSLKAWMIGVIIVLAVSFAGVFVAVGAIITSTEADKAAISNDMRDKIKEQTDNIENLTSQVNILTETLKNEQKSAQLTTQATN